MTAAPPDASWFGLVSVPRFGGRRLWDVWSGPGPRAALADLRRGVAPWTARVEPDVVREWQAAAIAADVDALARRHSDAGVRLTVHGDRRHPCAAERDPHLPPVLLWRGAAPPAVAGGPSRSGPPRVGIIGTRRASRYGIDLARELGATLTTAGVSVVSGLAAGIDAAAHHGAAAAVGGDAVPIAVVGTGHDVVYPRRNRVLWETVASVGVVVSEHALGTPPAAWRFPARNRVLAALCDLIVVVESHERGGSLITAGIAGARGVPVLAVPGAVHHPGSRGTNRLIADGCQPCLSPDDVFDALALLGRPAGGREQVAAAGAGGGHGGHGGHSGVEVVGDQAVVLDALGWTRRSFDDLIERCPALGIADVALALAELQAGERVAVDDGWYEQVR